MQKIIRTGPKSAKRCPVLLFLAIMALSSLGFDGCGGGHRPTPPIRAGAVSDVDKLSSYTDYLELGEAYESKGLSDKAIEAYETALKMTKEGGSSRDKSIALSHLARAHIVSNQPERGMEVLIKNTRQKERTQAYGDLANLFEKKGEFDKALEFYTKKIEFSVILAGKFPATDYIEEYDRTLNEIVGKLENILQAMKTEGESPVEKIEILKGRLIELCDDLLQNKAAPPPFFCPD